MTPFAQPQEETSKHGENRRALMSRIIDEHTWAIELSEEAEAALRRLDKPIHERQSHRFLFVSIALCRSGEVQTFSKPPLQRFKQKGGGLKFRIGLQKIHGLAPG